MAARPRRIKSTVSRPAKTPLKSRFYASATVALATSSSTSRRSVRFQTRAQRAPAVRRFYRVPLGWILKKWVDASGSISGSQSEQGIHMTAELEASAALSSSPVPAVVGSGKMDVIRVLLVEDDQSYREILADELSEHGFSIQSFGDGASLLAADDAARGVDVLVKRLRRAVDAAKPAAHRPADKSVVCGRLVLRPGVSRAYWDQVDVGLTLGEYNIVQLLASNAGRYVTYRAIYDRLHYEGFIAGSGEHGYRANVRSAIKRIRNKFRECDPDFVEIENYTAFGYCWGKPSGIS